MFVTHWPCTLRKENHSESHHHINAHSNTAEMEDPPSTTNSSWWISRDGRESLLCSTTWLHTDCTPTPSNWWIFTLHTTTAMVDRECKRMQQRVMDKPVFEEESIGTSLNIHSLSGICSQFPGHRTSNFLNLHSTTSHSRTRALIIGVHIDIEWESVFCSNDNRWNLILNLYLWFRQSLRRETWTGYKWKKRWNMNMNENCIWLWELWVTYLAVSFSTTYVALRSSETNTKPQHKKSKNLRDRYLFALFHVGFSQTERVLIKTLPLFFSLLYSLCLSVPSDTPDSMGSRLTVSLKLSI